MTTKPDPSLLSDNPKDNIAKITAMFSSPEDIRTRSFMMQDRKAFIIYHTRTVDKEILQNNVLKPLMRANQDQLADALPIVDIERITSLTAAADGLIRGNCLIMLDAGAEAWLVDVAANHIRSIQPPQNDQSIRAPQESFVEDLNQNVQMIHLRLRNKKLAERQFVLGSESPFHVSMLYMENLADAKVVEQIAARLQADEALFVKSPGTVNDYLEPHAWSVFPQLMMHERPDMTVSHLMEGRVALVIDGSSYSIVLPVTFFMFFQMPDDFVQRWWNATFLRFLRVISLLITIGLPAVYIAIVSNHFMVLPVDLVFSLKASLENVPLYPLFEALFMIIILELLKEAALQLPKSISPALSTVGGLVIGTEVVRANLVSTTMIVIIALTAVASFSYPNNEMRLSLRLIGFPIMLSSAFLGFAGIAFSVSLLVMYLTTLETYGVPYFQPVTPLEPKRLFKALVKLPKRTGRRVS